MHWLARASIVVGVNALALWIANLILHPSFSLNGNWAIIVLIGLILSLLNFFLKPVLTLIFGPIIVLTLGIGIVIVNAIILYLLAVIAAHIDFLNGSIIIQNIPALLGATLIISILNFIIHLAI
jgi:putative membrane protein